MGKSASSNFGPPRRKTTDQQFSTLNYPSFLGILNLWNWLLGVIYHCLCWLRERRKSYQPSMVSHVKWNQHRARDLDWRRFPSCSGRTSGHWTLRNFYSFSWITFLRHSCKVDVSEWVPPGNDNPDSEITPQARTVWLLLLSRNVPTRGEVSVAPASYDPSSVEEWHVTWAHAIRVGSSSLYSIPS